MSMGQMNSGYEDQTTMAAAVLLEGDEFGYSELGGLNLAAVSTDGGRGTAKEGSTDALLLAHLPTVRYVARQIHGRLPQHVDLEELVSAGIVGLMDAVTKFKEDKNTQFKTYAQFRIRGAIMDSLRSLDWSPRELRRKGRSVEEAIRSTTQRLGKTPSEIEIAAEMGLSLQEYQRLLTDLKALEIGSLNAERNDESGEEEMAYACQHGRPRKRKQGYPPGVSALSETLKSCRASLERLPAKPYCR